MRCTSDLARPAPLAAAALLALNDHVLKGAHLLPGWLTGKLSDIAGLFVAPILAVTVARASLAAAGRNAPRDGRLGATIVIAVAVAFTTLKLWPAFNAVVAAVWGANRLDPTDLYALPAVALAWLWLRDREQAAEAPGHRFVGGLALVGIALTCIATSAPPPFPPRPVAGWSVNGATITLACGEASAWVSKSGKTGFGLTVRAPCPLTITGARVWFADRRMVNGRDITLVQPEPGRADYHYIAFELDNNTLWNHGVRTARIELDLGAAGSLWTMHAKQAYVVFGAHR
jgi:hypothetical protein